MMRTLVIGDIHGNLPALRQVFSRAKFDPAKDRLIAIGDVFNNHPYSAGCVEELIRVKNLVWCLGNHDALALSWLRGEWGKGKRLGPWRQADLAAIKLSYDGGKTKSDKKRMKIHAAFVGSSATLYYVDEENRLFVHAGIDWDFPVNRQPDPTVYYTDRATYAIHAMVHSLRGTNFPYKDVFIGHTKTINEYPDGKPVRRANLWNIDTGAGSWGKLTIMDVDTYEYWQSDFGPRVTS